MPSRSIRNSARRRSASCAARPRPRKSRASIPAAYQPRGSRQVYSWRISSLDLDAALPYLTARGVSREVAAEFGLGLCKQSKTIKGRLAIPIHNVNAEIIAYAGRWLGADDAIPENEGKYLLPSQFYKK